jgi:FMN reductase
MGLARGAGAEVEMIELAELGPALFDPDDERVRAALGAVLSADTVVIATPAYKGTFTGILKMFVDLFPWDGVGGTAFVPVTVSGSPAHAASTDAALRQLLAVVKASVLPSLVVLESELEDLPHLIDAWKTASDLSSCR